jgi:hypothetical protein
MTVVPTLFQCMVRSPTEYDLRLMFVNGVKHTSIEKVQARAPGSLGQDVHDPCSGEWVIGSLTLRVLGYSVFVFRNGQIKVSGGSKEFQSGDYDTWLKDHVVIPVMKVLHEINETKQPMTDSFKICLLNGSMSIGLVANYKNLCFQIHQNVQNHPYFIKAILPVCFQSNGWMLKRGRVCSITIQFRSRDAPKLSTVRFDQGGRVQFFALRSMEELRRASTELLLFLVQCR